MKAIFILSVLFFSGCRNPDVLAGDYWGVTLPTSAKLVRTTGTSLYQKDKIIAMEFILSTDDFTGITAQPIGNVGMPTQIKNYSIGFMDYEFDTALRPDLLIAVHKAPGLLMYAVCDRSTRRLVLMRQDY